MKAISLFSGAGGLDLGISKAGFEIPLMVESDHSCCNTLRANFKGKVLEHDISMLSGTDLLLGQEVDLIHGGPPCQPFSSAGKMESLSDPRGRLIFEFARIVCQKRPKLFLMENVRGLVTAKGPDGTPGSPLLELVSVLEDGGYSCQAGLLNSVDYGSFQRRVRCILVGSKSGPPPQLPLPTVPKERWRTLGDFLAERRGSSDEDWIRPTREMASRLASVSEGKGLRSPGKRETTRPGGHWGYQQGSFIADRTLPARTVTGSSSQDWVRLDDGTLRRITFSEAAALQGFPDGWVFCGTKSQKFKQVGNAVQVDMAEALGKSMMGRLSRWKDDEPRTPFEIPSEMLKAMGNTRREEYRNGQSRRLGYCQQF